MKFLTRCRLALILFLLLSICDISAQETIHKFIPEQTGIDYGYGLVADGTYIYGTRYEGYTDGNGAVFRMKPDGSSYEAIFQFDGANGSRPMGQMVISGTTLYGVTLFGGVHDYGVVYRVETDGTGFQKLLDFNLTNGALPYGSLTLHDGVLYGVSGQGGAQGGGLIFKLNTNGTGFVDLHSFSGAEGDIPTGAVVVHENKLWGVTTRGGANQQGTIFSYDLSTNTFQKQYDFLPEQGYPLNGPILDGSVLYGATMYGGVVYRYNISSNAYTTINTGLGSAARLSLMNNVLYGVTYGGAYGAGAIFSLEKDGSNYKHLHNFSRVDGRDPLCGLLPINGTLYGHVSGGDHKYGVVFNYNATSKTFTELIDFTATNTGYDPNGSIVFSAGSGFGVTTNGGEYNQGTIYRINKNGSGYTVLHNFQDGANPEFGLTLSGSKLYGMTTMGGQNEMGVIFEIDTTGANYHVVFNFSTPEGGFPTGYLVEDGAYLYGMTKMGNAYNGVIFRYHKTSGAYERIFEFEGTDVKIPRGSYAISNGRLYGLALGGATDCVLFSIKLDGTDFQKILDDNVLTTGRYGNSVTIVGSTIYVTTWAGGSDDSGVLYKVQLDGTGFQLLKDFTWEVGILPDGEPVIVGDDIFGLLTIGGPSGQGGMYTIKTDGSGFHWVTNSEHGRNGRIKSGGSGSTQGSLAANGDFLYGSVYVTSGERKEGRIFRFDPQSSPEVPLSIEKEQAAFDIYPSPSDSYIFIKSAKPVKEVTMLNANGQKVQIQSPAPEIIDVRHLPAGVYTLLINHKAKRFIKR